MKLSDIMFVVIPIIIFGMIMFFIIAMFSQNQDIGEQDRICKNMGFEYNNFFKRTLHNDSIACCNQIYINGVSTKDEICQEVFI